MKTQLTDYEEAVDQLLEQKREIRKLEQSNADLLAALEFCQNYDLSKAEESHTLACQMLQAIATEARAAIAASKGE